VVLFDRDGPAIEASKVLVDNEHAAYRAVEHLISVGCKRVAHLAGPPDFAISSNRMQGYAAALSRYGLPEDPSLIIHCNFDRDAAFQAATELFTRPDRPDGIFAASDRIAIGAMLAARALKLRIPQDVAIVGFNDEPVAELLTPTLTSVRQPVHEIGQMAARMLIDQIEEGPEHYEPEIHVLQTELIIRESSQR
jgi:DNA-binding LacI/PurR family transcriptional regulator